MQKRTKKITAAMTRADVGSHSTKIIETHSHARSDTDDFGRFASVAVRAPESSRPERLGPGGLCPNASGTASCGHSHNPTTKRRTATRDDLRPPTANRRKSTQPMGIRLTALHVCSVSLLEWNGPPSNSSLSNTKNCSGLKGLAMPIKHPLQMLIHRVRRHIPQPEHDDAR